MLQPAGLGKLCQPHCERVERAMVLVKELAKVCRPVASAVKAKSPLPTDMGFQGSNARSSGLWRVTSAWRSMRAAQRQLAAANHPQTSKGSRLFFMLLNSCLLILT